MKMDYSTISLDDNGMLPSLEYYSYLLVLRGSGEFFHGNRCYSFSLHDLIDLPPHCSPVFKAYTSDPFLFGYIKRLDSVASSASSLCHVVPGENTGLIRRVFYLGLDMQNVGEPYNDSVQAAIDQLMFSTLIAANLKAKAMNAQVYEVIMDINNHFSETDYDPRPAIKKTGYTINHFRKLFREETGITPTEFVTVRRIDRSIELFQLFKDRISIKEIAWQSGYQDPYYFSRQFKQRTGLSPQQFISQL